MVRKKKQKQKPRVRLAQKSLLERLLRSTPLLLLAVLLTILFSNQGLLRKFETAALDTTMSLQTERRQPVVAIVRITDDDYRDLFHAKSPLEVTRLQEIIDAIALGKPKLIGIDIDTSAQDFARLRQSASGIPIIWARNAVFSKLRNVAILSDCLGGENPANTSGPVLFKQDEDGAVRRYTRMVRTIRSSVPSFGWTIVKQLGIDKNKGLAESEEELLINYVDTSRGLTQVNFSASEVLQQSSGAGYQTDGVFKDKIVLLGGDYGAQDERDTPLGLMVGVQALSQIIETEIEGGGTKPPGGFSLIVLQVIDGLLLVVLFQMTRLHKALLISCLLVPFLALTCSLIAFRSFAHWAYFVPVLFLIIGHQLYEQLKDYFKGVPPQIVDDLKEA